MRLAGFEHQETIGAGKVYRACLRYCKKQAEDANSSSEQTPLLPSPQQFCLPSTIEIRTAPTISLLSPLSSSQSSSTTSTLATKPTSSSQSSSRSDFLKLTTFQETRRTTQEAQATRAEEIAWKDTHTTAYKVGSIILLAHRKHREIQLSGESCNSCKRVLSS